MYIENCTNSFENIFQKIYFIWMLRKQDVPRFFFTFDINLSFSVLYFVFIENSKEMDKGILKTWTTHEVIFYNMYYLQLINSNNTVM